MISKHSAPSTSLPVGFRTWLWRHTCLLLLISMLWRRQAIFEWKGDKLPSPAECRIRTQGLWHIFASRLNACCQSIELSRIKLKNLNSTARPYDQQAFSPLNFTASWISHLALVIYMFVVFIYVLWYRQAILESKGDKLSSSPECRIRTQGLRHLFPSRLNACWQTNWAIENQAKKLELDSPSLWSASIQPTQPHCQLSFAPGSGDIHVCCF